MSDHEQPRVDSEDLLTPDKVAALLSVSVRSVRRYTEEGRLAPVRIGRNVRYRLTDVERLIASGMGAGGQGGHRTPDTGRGGQWWPQAATPPLSAREPLAAGYRVTPTEIEQAVSRTSAQYMGDLRTMLAEVGKVYEGQLAAKDQAIAAKDETIATQREALATQVERVAEQQGAIAELRRRAEAAEAELSLRSEKETEAAALFRRRIEQERKNRAGMQAAQDGRGAPGGVSDDAHHPASAAGFWARVRRVFGASTG